LGESEAAEKELASARKLAQQDFPDPLPISVSDFRTVVDEEVAALPQQSRSDLRLLRLELADLPDIADLTADQPILSPTIVGLFRGLPLGLPDSEPRSIVLYRKNLLRIVATREEFRAQVRTTLLHELGHLRGEDDDELRARGLE
ncbi:MAG: metallopeptidase family protein, partial [Deltaproteobacteria bacterium]|nr:metallopeptidase family protein [Deltaproteobacteria bacterium]